MKALIFESLNSVKLREVPKPVIIDENDAIVRISLTSICGSDMHLIHGHLPTTPGYIIGHEYVGVVEAVGKNVTNIKVGQRVSGPAGPYCGKCYNCIRDNISQCLNGGAHGAGPEFGNLAGTHCEYTRVPFADNVLVPIPDDVTDEQALFVGDIMSTGYFGAEKGCIKEGDNVAVFGAGPVGLSAVHTAKLFNPKKIILVGNKDRFRLEKGLKLGATDIIVSSEEDVLARINQLTDGRGVDAAIDAAGVESTVHQALRCVGVGGKVALIAAYTFPITFPMNELWVKSIRIEMGFGYLGHMKYLMSLVQSGKIDLTPLITHRMSLDEIEKAYELFENRSENVLKIAIKP